MDDVIAQWDVVFALMLILVLQVMLYILQLLTWTEFRLDIFFRHAETIRSYRED